MHASIQVAVALLMICTVGRATVAAAEAHQAGRTAAITVIPAKQAVKTIGKTVVVNYPLFTGGDTTTCRRLNAAMQRHIRECNFYGDLASWTLKGTSIQPAAVSVAIAVCRIGGAHRLCIYSPFNYQFYPEFKEMKLDDLFGQKPDYKKLCPVVQRYLIADLRAWDLNSDPEEQFGGDWLQPDYYEGFSFDKEGVTFALNLGAESMNGYSIKVPYDDIAHLFALASPLYKYVNEPAKELKTLNKPPHLLLPGDHHAAEVSAKSGERWLVFSRSNSGGLLSEQILKVEKAPDPVHPKVTGKRVSASRGPKPLFLVRGIAGLRPGPVRCSDLTESRMLGPNGNVVFKFGGKEYTLSIKTWKSKAKSYDENSPEANYFDMQEISLSDGKDSKIINSLPNIHLHPDSTWGPTLLWAGDLDRDGKLDLLMDTSHYDNRSEWTLFLSSGAKAGDFLRKVALFVTYGC